MSTPTRVRDRIVISFEVYEEEREQIRENAAWFGMTLSGFLRYTALGNTIDRKDKGVQATARRRRRAVSGAAPA